MADVTEDGHAPGTRAEPTDNRELASGQLINGKYRVIRRIGTGGMGIVYAARRTSLEDVVALKIIIPERAHEANRARFVREARALARIRHPNVVQVFDFGQWEGRPYMVMELLEGPTLEAKLQYEGTLDAADALSIFADMCAAVEAGHRRGVVHRDLKPGNVILARRDDGGETVKVLDFGLAHFTHEVDVGLTQAGALLGTCSYMSPEQIEGAGIGPASDIFALGVILYEMVTGRLPFVGKNQVATMLAISDGSYVPIRELVPHVPRALGDAVDVALRRDPESRPGTPRELLARAGGAHPSRPRESMSTRSSSGATTQSDEPRPREDTRAAGAGDGTGDEVGSAFVGRAAELEILREELDSVATGDSKIVVVMGEIGIGKTRLLDRFLAEPQIAGRFRTFRGRFHAYEGDRPPSNETWLRMLAGVSGTKATMAAEVRPGGAAVDLGTDKWAAFAHLAEAFSRRGHGRPLLIAVDDLQWATQLDLEFLAHLGRGNTPNPVLVLGTARSDAARSNARTELSRWLLSLAAERTSLSVELSAFSQSETRSWLDATYPGLRMRPEDLRALQRGTDGNPFYLAEVTRHLVATKTLVERDSQWVCNRLGPGMLPSSVTSVIEANLESLPDELRSVLELATVVGEELRFETLHAASALDEDELEERLERLVELGLMTEEGLSAGNDFGFASTTTRSVAYGILKRRRRKKLHKHVVGALESLYANDLERLAQVLCYHYHATGDWNATMRWGVRAAQVNTERFDMDGARRCLDWVRDAVSGLERDRTPIGDVEHMRLDLLDGTWNVRTGHYEHAALQLRAAESLAASLGMDTERLDALIELGQAQLGLGDLEAAVSGSGEAVALARTLGDPARTWRAITDAGLYAARLGRFEDGMKILAEVTDGEPPAGLEARRAVALRELAWIEGRCGRLAEATRHAREAQHYAERSRDEYAQYNAVSVTALVLAANGRMKQAVPRYREALTMARRLSLRRREMVELANLAQALLAVGQSDEALRNMLQVVAICTELGDSASEGDARVGLGRVLRSRGDLEEAIASLELGLQRCDAAGRVEYAGIAKLEIGGTELEQGHLDAARAALTEALERLQPLDSIHAWNALFSLARCERAAGVPEEARARAHDARKRLERHVADAGPGSSLADDLAELDRFIAELDGDA